MFCPGHVHVYSSSQAKMVASKKVGSSVLSLTWDQSNSLYVGGEAGSVQRVALGDGEEGEEGVGQVAVQVEG